MDNKTIEPKEEEKKDNEESKDIDTMDNYTYDPKTGLWTPGPMI